ncbi:Putative gilgamesh, partial [Caligus rogercresseyi]
MERRRSHRVSCEKRRSNNSKAHWKKLFAVRKFLSLANSQSSQEPAKQLIFNKFRVGKKIANGSFGQIRLGIWTRNKESVAIKLEHQEAKIPMLFFEYRFYETLLNEIGFPKIYHFGSFGNTTPLSWSYSDQIWRNSSLPAIDPLASQQFCRSVIHSHGIIFRDVKPENFLIGHSSNKKGNLIHIVDFGLAKEYIDPQTGRHISYSENKFLTGTVRYMSINAHKGKEQSRRDDMEALCHVFFYFLSKGNLPWMGTSCKNIREKYQIIGVIKEETPMKILGKEFPWEFTVFLRYCRSLKFTQSPNYNYLRNLFRNCLKRLGMQEDYVFDWSLPLREESSLTLALETEKQQIGEEEETGSLSNTSKVPPQRVVVEVNKPSDRQCTNNNNNTTFSNKRSKIKPNNNVPDKVNSHQPENVNSDPSLSYSKSKSLPSSINVIISSSICSSKKSSKRMITQGIQRHIKNIFHLLNTSSDVTIHEDSGPVPNIRIEYCSSSSESSSSISVNLKSSETPQPLLDTLQIVSSSSKQPPNP